MKESEEFYSLSIEDIQTVAEQVYYRRLTPTEIEKVIPTIENHMPWFEVIESAIQEAIAQ